MVPESNAPESPTTSADSASANNGSHDIHLIHAPADFACSIRCRANQAVDNGEIDTIEADYQFKMADFIERFNCWPMSRRPIHRNWFGFGEVQVIFADDDDNAGFWATLVDACAVSGLDYEAGRTMFEEDRDDGYDDVFDLEWLVNDDGDHSVVPLVRHSFIMRAMLGGPWAKEYMDNTMNLFRHAAIHSGLADQIGGVVRIREDGTAEETGMTFGEFLAGDEKLPTEAEAREQASRGPLGGGL